MIKGSIVALATPFTEAGEIDFAALSSLVSFQLEAGTEALVIGGTTGESATLRAGEFEALLDAVAQQISGRVPLIAGTGSPASRPPLSGEDQTPPSLPIMTSAVFAGLMAIA